GVDPVRQVSSADKMLFIRSQHASMISGLHSRLPIYASVARLAKRWFPAHLFSCCLAEEAIELLVAYVFLTPLPLGVPCSPFFRLLADYDWLFYPNKEKEINDNFMSSRKGYEEDRQNISSATFLAAPYDKASEAWTTTSPNFIAGKHVARGKASTAFNPFLLPGDLKRSPEELKNLMKESFLGILSLCGRVQDEFGTLKPWYDHIGGDTVGLAWTKHNSKKRERDEEEVETNPIGDVKGGRRNG
ncbi:hypothetical protein EUTSA_v100213920mg, partial [Eutrema salsugineum]